MYNTGVGHTGESLVIHNISRMCADDYECVASNGVDPAISQSFKVTVLCEYVIKRGNLHLITLNTVIVKCSSCLQTKLDSVMCLSFDRYSQNPDRFLAVPTDTPIQ